MPRTGKYDDSFVASQAVGDYGGHVLYWWECPTCHETGPRLSVYDLAKGQLERHRENRSHRTNTKAPWRFTA